VSHQQELPFPGGSLVVTRHALDRFIERSPNRILPSNVLKVLARLLEEAEPDKGVSPLSRVRSIFNNNFKIAEYWKSSGWRFVIVRERNVPVLVTVKRIYK